MRSGSGNACSDAVVDNPRATSRLKPKPHLQPQPRTQSHSQPRPQPEPQLRPQPSHHPHQQQQPRHPIKPQPSASRLSASRPAPQRPATKASTTTTTTTTSAPRLGSTPPDPQGPPLTRPTAARQPNQHVLSVRAAAAPTTRSSTKRDAATMPPGDKPRQPQLSAGPPRGMTRTPLTPKVAVKGPPATTPLARKSSSVAGAQSPRGESAAAPPGSYLSHNGTPRSGARQSRAESTISTGSSANLDKMSDGGWETRSNRGLGVSPLARNDSLSSRRSVTSSSSTGPGEDSKFFYASSVKPSAQAPPPRPASVVHTKSTPTFFYASDAASKRVTSPPAYPSSSTHSLASAQEGVATKFFYANGAPDMDARLSARSSGTGSTISSGSRATRANTSNSSAVGSSTTQLYSRPASPSKNLTHPTLPQQQQQHAQPTLRASAMSPTSPIRASVHPAPKLAAAPAQANKRRVSVESPLRLNKGHGRAGSVVSVEGGAAVPKIASPTSVPPTIHAPDITPPLLSPGLAQLAQPMTMASILQMADEMEDEDEDDDEDASGGEGEDGEDGDSDDSENDSVSRKRSSQNSEPLDHLVLSARRERKVQDLEITNASLEAINRTLERQLRKQSAELRRFRRLSRAGRLPSGAAAASQGGASLTVPDASGGLTDVSEKEEDAAKMNGELDEDDDDEDEEDDEDEDSLVDSDLSHGNTTADPNSTTSQSKAESPGDKRRKRDERRLQLDLTRHQELLLDSQKMNQSLKKCLDWTEVLIKEGQKALAYRVRIADVDAMPGRVLAASYYDYGDDTSQVEDDTVSTVSASRFDDDTISNIESEAEAWPKEAQDRDSGIELPVAGQ